MFCYKHSENINGMKDNIVIVVVHAPETLPIGINPPNLVISLFPDHFLNDPSLFITDIWVTGQFFS